MTTATTSIPTHREPQLLGQTVVVIGASAGIGRETARRSHAEGLEARREELRTKLPIGRVVGPEDVAAHAVHIVNNTALSGARYDVDGGRQFVW
jgi:NAD(P)-dependent dehydrogenase (short-subunit alcohol dehydrogenase family)